MYLVHRGHHYHGPFTSAEAAAEWAKDEFKDHGEHWAVCPMEKPKSEGLDMNLHRTLHVVATCGAALMTWQWISEHVAIHPLWALLLAVLITAQVSSPPG